MAGCGTVQQAITRPSASTTLTRAAWARPSMRLTVVKEILHRPVYGWVIMVITRVSEELRTFSHLPYDSA